MRDLLMRGANGDCGCARIPVLCTTSTEQRTASSTSGRVSRVREGRGKEVRGMGRDGLGRVERDFGLGLPVVLKKQKKRGRTRYLYTCPHKSKIDIYGHFIISLRASPQPLLFGACALLPPNTNVINCALLRPGVIQIYLTSGRLACMRVYACTWCVWEIAFGSVATHSTCVRSASEPSPFICCPSSSHSTSTRFVLHLLRCTCAAPAAVLHPMISV